MAKRRARNWTDILEELYVDSWNPTLQRFRSPFAFRGMGQVNHVLSSPLVRLAERRADVRRLEMALLRNFRKYAHPEAVNADSIWELLALGQHRGLPTRLLDWTYSPLVALHFATEDPATFRQDGVIWCVNFVEANKRLPRRLKRILEQEGSETLTVDMLDGFRSMREFDALAREPFLVFLEPPAMDRRILNQFALFSLMSSPLAEVNVWLERHPDLCRQVIVPSRLKWEIRDKLDQANVNERVLFPDLDGLSRWLARYYRPAQSMPTVALEDHGSDSSLDASGRNRRTRRSRSTPARRARRSPARRR